jgi:transposase
MTKPKYDREFKIQTVQLILEEGKPVTQAARELGISDQTLYRWVSEYREDPQCAFQGSGNLKPDDKATRELQKRIRDLEEENAILKKAMHIFAKDLN